MGPIFNEKVAEKWNLWIRKQCTNALFIGEKSTSAGWKKKKKKKKEKFARQKRRCNNQLNPNTHQDETKHEDAICRVTKEGLSKGPIPDPPFDGLTCQEALNPFSSSRGFFFFVFCLIVNSVVIIIIIIFSLQSTHTHTYIYIYIYISRAEGGAFKFCD